MAARGSLERKSSNEGKATARTTTKTKRNWKTSHLTDDERKEIREAFDVLDNDKDGRLNAAELETLLRGQFVVASNKELKELLENMDADKDGSVDYEEFEAFVAKNGLYKASVEEVSQELKDAFQVFDRDGDGYIDVDEFKSVMMNIGDKMSEEEVKKMMEEADSDKDGKIDYNEFIHFMSKGMY